MRATSTRFSLGISTPAIRAIVQKLLSLSLLVARVGTNHANSTMTPNDSALVTDLFDAGADLHWDTWCWGRG